MEMTKIELYKLRKTQDMPNIKEIIGEIVTPIAEYEHEYTDADGEVHKVLALKLADGRYMRTEVTAFIENYHDYIAVFGEDAERPAITITGKKSKRGNPFVNFTVAGE